MQDYDELTNLLPKATFQSIIENNQIYVDKTALIKSLAHNNFALFLSRPRRFGKSTLVSALEELYSHGVKPFKDENGDIHESYFKGLAIEKLWKDEKTYKVIHIDFSQFNRNTNEAKQYVAKYTSIGYPSERCAIAVYSFGLELRKCFENHIRKFGLESKIDTSKIIENLDVLKAIVNALGNEQVVILIDEYDHPLLNIPTNLDTEEEQNSYRNDIVMLMQDLYSYLKGHQYNFRKIFITGITRLKDSALFTLGNNITDISLDPTYSAIVGFTRDEIRKYFPLHLQYCASNLYHIDEDQIMPCHIEKLLDDMANWYDGYCFDLNDSCHVFSTISVLNFFSLRNTTFNNFWYNLGGLPSLLRTNINKILSTCRDEQNFLDGISVPYSDFENPSTYQDMKPAILLYQTGYFTLARQTDVTMIDMKVPNHELKNSLALLACSYLFKEKIEELGKGLLSFSMSVDELYNYLYKILNLTNYDHNPLTQESSVTHSYNMFFSGNRQYRVTVDSHSLKGRSDLRVDMDGTHTFVFEFKFNKKDSNESDDKLLKEAIAQMQDKDYLKIEGRKVRGFAVVYNDEKRELTKIKEVYAQSKSI